MNWIELWLQLQVIGTIIGLVVGVPAFIFVLWSIHKDLRR